MPKDAIKRPAAIASSGVVEFLRQVAAAPVPAKAAGGRKALADHAGCAGGDALLPTRQFE